MGLNQPLILPAKKVTGVSTYPPMFTGATRDWSGVPCRAADAHSLPIAWTPYQMSLLDGVSESAWIASHVYSGVPPRWFAQPGTLIAKPKLVLYNLSEFFGINLNNIFRPLASGLAAKKVLVVAVATEYAGGFSGTFGFGFAIFRMFLPHYGASDFIVDHLPDFGTIAFRWPLVRPADWISGEVLYLDGVDGRAGAVHGAQSDVGTGAFDPYLNNNQIGVGLLNDARGRYDKFGYHIAYTLSADESGLWLPGIRPQYQALIEGTVASVPGASLTVFPDKWPAVRAAVEADLQAKVKSFFNL